MGEKSSPNRKYKGKKRKVKDNKQKEIKKISITLPWVKYSEKKRNIEKEK